MNLTKHITHMTITYITISWSLPEKVTNKEVLVHTTETMSTLKTILHLDDWGMISGTITFSMLQKRKWQARPCGVGKGWSYCVRVRERLWIVERLNLKTDQDEDRIASENARQKPAGNSRSLKAEITIMAWCRCLASDLRKSHQQGV